MTAIKDTMAKYVSDHLRLAGGVRNPKVRDVASALFEKALSVLPEEVLDLFVSGARSLKVIVMPDAKLPLGMTTRSEGPPARRTYTIFLYEEHGGWPEDHFIGALLHELAHVVGERPPETEWPTSRGERARFKERLECRADSMVWRWGLKHYDMRFLTATYPQHWVERIVKDIERMLDEENVH